MSLPSQFSLEEENYYKTIQDLVKKGSHNEKELSTFLERYMGLLGRVGLDDETFSINFTKAGLILEASAKVYGSKVDGLWINLERVLESLKAKAQNSKRKSQENEDGVEDEEGEAGGDDGEGIRKLSHGPRRRRKLGDALSSPDDFLEIDIFKGLSEKNMNESKISEEKNIKFHEKIPNLFLKNQTERKRIDVCLIKENDDRDDCRLRDWIISADNKLIKEIYPSRHGDTSIFINNISDTEKEDYEMQANDDGFDEPSFLPESREPGETDMDQVPLTEETNNNVQNLASETLAQQVENEKFMSTENRDMVVEAMNISEEVDLAKFPNIFLRRLEDNLVDVNEVFWNSTKFEDLIPSKKMRANKTVRLPCQLCADKKRHKKKGGDCSPDSKSDSLDAFFAPHVQPSLSDPHFGVLPDEELFAVYEEETALLVELAKVDSSRNINEAYHPDGSPQELKNFIGFDDSNSFLMRKKREFDGESFDDNPGDFDDDGGQDLDDGDHNQNFELPFPITEGSIRIPSRIPDDMLPTTTLEKSQTEYHELVLRESKDQNEAKTSFEKNKELGMKISKWHSSLVDKLQLSQKRGALNMNVLAEKIMGVFPQQEKQDKPIISFQQLVKNQNRKDIPRYFLACLQLTNEGNVDIHKSCSERLAVDCMMLTKLRTRRIRHELDEYSPGNTSQIKSPGRQMQSQSSKSPSTSSKRRRNSVSSAQSDSEDEVRTKKKKSKSQKKVQKSRKRRSSSSDNPVSKNRKKRKDSEDFCAELTCSRA